MPQELSTIVARLSQAVRLFADLQPQIVHQPLITESPMPQSAVAVEPTVVERVVERVVVKTETVPDEATLRELETVKKQCDKLLADNAGLLAENGALHEDYAALQANNEALSAKNAELQAKNEELTAQNTELQAKNEELTAQNAAQQAENAALAEKLATATRGLNEAGALLSECQQKMKTTEQQLDDCRSRVAALQQQLMDSRQQSQQLQQRIDELSNDSSAVKAVVDRMRRLAEALLSSIEAGGFLLDCNGNNSEVYAFEQNLARKVKTFYRSLDTIAAHSAEEAKAAIRQQLTSLLDDDDSWLQIIARFHAYSRLTFLADATRDSGSYFVRQKMDTIYRQTTALLAAADIQLQLPLLYVETLNEGRYTDVTGQAYGNLESLDPNCRNHLDRIDLTDRRGIIADIARAGYYVDGNLRQQAQILL